ncbi:DUF6893 family small protein [Streptomyces sioyaensis]
MLKLAMSGVLAAALAAILKSLLPDLKRYLRIRSM